MLPKTATSLAFATACLTAIAMTPAHAQKMAPGMAPGTSYQGSTAPDWSQGNPGYTSGNYAPQANQGTNWSQGNYGATGMGGTEVITNGPQGSPPSNWSAQQNVRESQRYDRLLESNRGFREARMRRECGPITDPELHQQCIASFHQDEPYAGSSSSGRHTRSDMGR
jgi:hypothetical protein